MNDRLIKYSLLLKKYPRSLIVAISLLFGLFIGFYIGTIVKDIHHDNSEQIRLGKGEFTNPLLECEVAEDTIKAISVHFDIKLKEFVSKILKSNNGLNISVYFRDMNNGPVIGINEDTTFLPASLLKVPVMMSYFKHAEREPSILNKEIEYSEKQGMNISQTYIPSKSLEIGDKYSVSELINRMIKYSDNEALALLWPNISMSEYVELYTLLGVDPDTILDPNRGITVKEYSRFFRILFNSSFLTQEDSEKALGILASSEFKDGIKKNLPSDIKVASKFGERNLMDGVKQIHECGIVYYPNHPYLICIMTRGPESDDLTKFITDISNFVYSEVKTQYQD